MASTNKHYLCQGGAFHRCAVLEEHEPVKKDNSPTAINLSIGRGMAEYGMHEKKIGKGSLQGRCVPTYFFATVECTHRRRCVLLTKTRRVQKRAVATMGRNNLNLIGYCRTLLMRTERELIVQYLKANPNGVSLSRFTKPVRQIIFFPRGYNIEDVSAFLKCCDSNGRWSRRVNFTITIVNHVDTKRSFVKCKCSPGDAPNLLAATDPFTWDVPDRGFSQMSNGDDWEDVFDSESGFLINGKDLKVNVKLEVWIHSFITYGSGSRVHR